MPMVSPLHKGTHGPPDKGVSPSLSPSPDRSQCQISQHRTENAGTRSRWKHTSGAHTPLSLSCWQQPLSTEEALLGSALTWFFQMHNWEEGMAQVTWPPARTFPLMYLVTCYNGPI